MKHCSGCGQSKRIDDFYRHRARPDGRQDWCKDCQREMTKSPSEADALIIAALETLAKLYERIFPHMVQGWIDLVIGERTVRRKMALMAAQGKIRRLGPRSGYLPN